MRRGGAARGSRDLGNLDETALGRFGTRRTPGRRGVVGFLLLVYGLRLVTELPN